MGNPANLRRSRRVSENDRPPAVTRVRSLRAQQSIPPCAGESSIVRCLASPGRLSNPGCWGCGELGSRPCLFITAANPARSAALLAKRTFSTQSSRLRRPLDYSAEQGARFEIHFEKSRGFQGLDAEPFETQLLGDQWAITAIKAGDDLDTIKALRKQGLSIRDIVDSRWKQGARFEFISRNRAGFRGLEASRSNAITGDQWAITAIKAGDDLDTIKALRENKAVSFGTSVDPRAARVHHPTPG